MFKSFINHIINENLWQKNNHLLIAVSGGVDSMVLVDLCNRANFKLSIAHCNFQLRNEESNRDELFVTSAAKDYKVDFYVQKFNTLEIANQLKISIQETARNLRYSWFESLKIHLKEKKNIENIILLTAHHANDNIETILMHFFRGTGLTGLTGIPAKNGIVVRPLLPFFKEEIFEYATENKIKFIEDSSNSETKYTRNFFRHQVIPLVEEKYLNTKLNLKNNIERFSEIEKLYKIGVEKILHKLIHPKNNEFHVPFKQLFGYKNDALIFELIKKFNFKENQIKEVKKLEFATNGSNLISPDKNFRLIKFGNWFIFSTTNLPVVNNYVIEKTDQKIITTLGKLEITTNQNANISLSSDRNIARLNKKNIVYPILLRKHKPGDYFYPLGLKKKKKLARFLIDQKLSKTEKEKILVLESNKKIIWVVGYRIDDRFKITPFTQSSIQFNWLPG